MSNPRFVTVGQLIEQLTRQDPRLPVVLAGCGGDDDWVQPAVYAPELCRAAHLGDRARPAVFLGRLVGEPVKPPRTRRKLTAPIVANALD